MIKVLGISGSPRKGTTDWSVQKSLEILSQYPGIETNYWSVRGKKLSPCNHCDRCVRENTLCYIEDDFNEVQQLILEADAIFIGSPVYDMTITAQLAMIMNRMRPNYLVNPGKLRNKVGAALAIGGTRHGGQEMTINAILNYFLMNEMLVFGGLGGCYNGATLWSKDDRTAGAQNDTVGCDTLIRQAKGFAEAILTTIHGREKAGALLEEHGLIDEDNSPIRDH